MNANLNQRSIPAPQKNVSWTFWENVKQKKADEKALTQIDVLLKKNVRKNVQNMVQIDALGFEKVNQN